MSLRRLLRSAAAGSAFMLAATAAPALASDGPPPVYAHPQAVASGHGMTPEMRDRWLAECRDRLSGTYKRRKAESRCLAYLDDYYAYYRSHPSHGGQGVAMAYGYPAHTQAYGAGCCQQPVTMVPVPRPQRRAPECTETIEYEYVSAPRRAAPPRPIPQKVVPDKRVRLK